MSSIIQSTANWTGVDPRFILAILMEESNGCVRAPTTNEGVRNLGLMRSHDGTGTCNDSGVIQDPCPSSEITQMIEDGTAGTSSGDGLKQCLAETGVSDMSMYYKAARIYNSGSIDKSGNLGAGGSTHCYVSNIANRLMGWASGPSGCNSSTIEELNGSSPISSAIEDSVTTSTFERTLTSNIGAQSSDPALSGGVFAMSAAVGNSASITITTSSIGTGISGPGGLIMPGGTCTTEGMWNCISGISFQRCASGIWSVVKRLSAGLNCTAG